MFAIDRRLIFLFIGACFLLMSAGTCLAQQGYLTNTTVTLYYYDNATATKGAVVPMPDNPQYVNSDPAAAAPGMYTFSHVPSANWYYLEADHEGNKWYTIFFMEDNVGTKTANVHIPPMKPVNATTPTPQLPPIDTPPPVLASSPTPTTTPIPTPGMTLMAAIVAVSLAMALICQKRP
jgi:hypothetical protein